jgi:predicted nucleic acid-binding protein
MTSRILDTSVAVAWYLEEAFSPRARMWRDRLVAGDVRLVAPPLHLLEFGNVLRTRVRRGELDEKLAREINDLHQDAPIAWEEPDPRGLLDLALRFDATVYDAAYISLALRHRMPLLTAERTTTPWVTKLGRLAEAVA